MKKRPTWDDLNLFLMGFLMGWLASGLLIF